MSKRKNLRRNITHKRADELQHIAVKARQLQLPAFNSFEEEGKPHSRLISRRQVCERTHLTFPTIWKFIRAGKFPPARAVGGKTMFIEAEVQAWIDALPVREFKELEDTAA
jgi:predicted DNA-binding transcriptional regulator AlpA